MGLLEKETNTHEIYKTYNRTHTRTGIGINPEWPHRNSTRGEKQ